MRTITLATAVLLLAASYLATPATAQSASPAPPTLAGSPAGTSLTVGYFNIDFDYASAQRGYAYSFNGPATTLLFAGSASSLSVAFGRHEAYPYILPGAMPDPSALMVTSTLVDVALTTGGNVNIVQAAAPVPFQVFVPIRLNFDYRFLSADEDDDYGDPVGAVHLPGISLGAGVGGWLRLPTDVPFLQDRLVGLGSLVVSYGGMNEIAHDFEIEDTRVTRSTDFNLEARIERLLANRTGVSLGYTFRTQYWSDDYVRDIGSGASRWVENLDAFTQRNRQHLLRIGINW